MSLASPSLKIRRTISLDKSTNFEKALNEHFSFGAVEGKRKFCNKETMHEEEVTTFQQALSIQGEPPKFLIVQLKIFNSLGEKCPFSIEFPKDGVVTLKQGTHRFLYTCKGYLQHEGETIKNGHYTAYVKWAQDQWYFWNADEVQPAEPPSTLPGVYLVLLER